nr:MAG TPA: hypothetical protein [Caudoviricetes sp.]
MHSAAHTVLQSRCLSKGLHKHIDIEPPSCFGGPCHITGEEYGRNKASN